MFSRFCKYFTSFFAFFLISATMPSPQNGTPSNSLETPNKAQPELIDSCTKLSSSHQEFAKALDKKEQALFCSVFDSNQRDAALDYYKKNPKLTQKDAVMQIAKDNKILFDSKPGGACGAH